MLSFTGEMHRLTKPVNLMSDTRVRVLIGSDTDLSEHLNIRNHLDTYIAGRTTEIERLRTEHRLA